MIHRRSLKSKPPYVGAVFIKSFDSFLWQQRHNFNQISDIVVFTRPRVRT